MTAPITRDWPSESQWQSLRDAVGDRLITPKSPLQPCMDDPASAECGVVVDSLVNPYFAEDDPGAMLVNGWLDAWSPEVSPYAVAAKSAADISHALKFARALTPLNASRLAR